MAEPHPRQVPFSANVLGLFLWVRSGTLFHMNRWFSNLLLPAILVCALLAAGCGPI